MISLYSMRTAEKQRFYNVFRSMISLYSMRTAKKQRFYNVFRSMISLYSMRTAEEQRFYNVFRSMISLYSCEQLKRRGFTMFSGQWSLFITHGNSRRREVWRFFQVNNLFLLPHANSRRAEILQCSQPVDTFLYSMWTTERRGFTIFLVQWSCLYLMQTNEEKRFCNIFRPSLFEQ